MNFSSFAPSSFFVTLTWNEEPAQKLAREGIQISYLQLLRRLPIETNDGAKTQIEACRAGEQMEWQRHAKHMMTMMRRFRRTTFILHQSNLPLA